ncbi:MAG TPA: hypothetical protein DEO65_10095 [Bacillus bacterium]|uniref:Uncharacterized protein n=1 Tax=Siminovitchia fordii TaxID=254759 RepID=A0ABQ4K2T3_9BACI|nr:hypothetical protein J1TS3_03170 [Siminovitchia fordii]HBZ10212.1 hypothetical protein [Bacillus sp. (in: firmicutes)]
MSAIKKYDRFSILSSQFPFKNIPVHSPEYDSLNRIFHFLLENTDVYYLFFLKEETLIQYLKYHQSKQFKIISFTQAISDIKIFTLYLKNNKEINKEIKFDVSLQNYNLWINL